MGYSGKKNFVVGEKDMLENLTVNGLQDLIIFI